MKGHRAELCEEWEEFTKSAAPGGRGTRRSEERYFSWLGKYVTVENT